MTLSRTLTTQSFITQELLLEGPVVSWFFGATSQELASDYPFRIMGLQALVMDASRILADHFITGALAAQGPDSSQCAVTLVRLPQVLMMKRFIDS